MWGGGGEGWRLAVVYWLGYGIENKGTTIKIKGTGHKQGSDLAAIKSITTWDSRWLSRSGLN